MTFGKMQNVLNATAVEGISGDIGVHEGKICLCLRSQATLTLHRQLLKMGFSYKGDGNYVYLSNKRRGEL